MSVHDETWDRCKHCKQVVKTWHGNYHENGHCRVMSFEEFEKGELDRIRRNYTTKLQNTSQHNDFLRVV
jgi:hypothetical protein